MTEFIVIGLFTFAGMMTQTIVGFGGAFFMTPIMLAYFSGPIAVTVTLLTCTLIGLMVLFNERRSTEILWPVVLRVFIPAIPGLILGAYIVTKINKGALQVAVGLLIILSVTIQEYVFPKPSRQFGVTKGISLSGFASGVLNGSAAIGGPPLVLWARSHIHTPNQIRHNFSAILVLMNLVGAIIIQVLKPGGFTSKSLTVLALLVPVVVVGYICGRLLITRINVKHYHKIVFVSVILAGLVSVGFGLAALT
jgi:uncharacterized membrane protein YfcA